MTLINDQEFTQEPPFIPEEFLREAKLKKMLKKSQGDWLAENSNNSSCEFDIPISKMLISLV